MKDIYFNMSNQNILNYYGSKLDIKVDKSSIFDREQETRHKIDLVLDYSETYDFQLDPNPDFELINPEFKSKYKLILSLNLSTDDYYLTDNNGNILSTQGYNPLQFNF